MYDLSLELPWRRELMAHARQFLSVPSEAEDVVQEVHLRAWSLQQEGHNAGLFDSEDQLRRWLFTWTKFTALAMSRQRRRWESGRNQVPNPIPGSKRAINAAIAELPEEEARVVRLLIDGYSQRDVASLVGVSQPTVSRTLATAIERVRQLCEKS